jgi:hypothetical protein
MIAGSYAVPNENTKRMSVVGALTVPSVRLFAAWRQCMALLLVAAPAAHAQPPRLTPAAPPVEVVDPSERISGNAAVGLAFVQPADTIGSDRLWAYLSAPVAPKLKLKISSIDGRYYAEVDYVTNPAAQTGWVALDLTLRSFAFLEKSYPNPTNEIAVLLADADAQRVYPVRWGQPHSASAKPATPPAPPQDSDSIRVYMNTERAQAFLVVGGSPAYCRDASALSGFKFNAVCDATLGSLRQAEKTAPGQRLVSGLEVFRRSGVRTLAPVALDVTIQY